MHELLIINKKDFKEWLECKADTEIIDGGMATSVAKTCPIARYVNTFMDGEITVGPNGIVVNGQAFHVPRWVAKFVGAFDVSVGDKVGTVALAKEVLRDVSG